MNKVIGTLVNGTHDSNQNIEPQNDFSYASPHVCSSYPGYTSPQANDGSVVDEMQAITNPEFDSSYSNAYARGHANYPDRHSRYPSYSSPDTNDGSNIYEEHAIVNPEPYIDYSNPLPRGHTSYPDQNYHEATHGSHMYQQHAKHNSWVHHDHRNGYQSQYYGNSYTSSNNYHRACPYGKRCTFKDCNQDYHNSYNGLHASHNGIHASNNGIHASNNGQEHAEYKDEHRHSEASGE